jgi:hypothetical protein
VTLRDLLHAAFDAHTAINDLAVALAVRTDDLRRATEQHDRATAAVAKLQVLASTAPPDEDVAPMMSALMGAAQAAISLALEGAIEVRGRRLLDIRREADAGLSHAVEISKRWNAKLWKATEQVPSDIVKG